MIRVPSDMVEGYIHPTRKWGDIKILNYFGRRNVLIEFMNSGVIRETRAELIRKGIAEDLTVPSLFGVGFLGVGDYTPNNNSKEHVHWKGILERGYCPKLKLKRPTYTLTQVASTWHNFQNFAEWCQHEKGFFHKGWELDKDLLIKGNKLYSPETCVFLPQAINLLLVCGSRTNELPIGVTYSDNGVGYRAYCSNRGKTLSKRSSSIEECFSWYKATKEKVIQSLADEYKELLDEVAYKALYNYKVEWDD